LRRGGFLDQWRWWLRRGGFLDRRMGRRWLTFPIVPGSWSSAGE
jgi:hypothetical protein